MSVLFQNLEAKNILICGITKILDLSYLRSFGSKAIVYIKKHNRDKIQKVTVQAFP